MPVKARHILIIGGARSGKSAFAETLAPDVGRRVYVATAEMIDAEIAERIARHRARRGSGWTTVEAPLTLATAIRAHGSADTFVLVDCISFWLENLLRARRDVDKAVDELLEATRQAEGTLVLVTNEVGMGVTPEGSLARRLRNVAGITNQRLAQDADEVILITAGLPLQLKH